jgi:hypothetical protein
VLLWTGLGLVSVPILIHLFFRRRHRVVRWAAMDFLLAALRKQKRRIQVENLLLLLLRCALIALLALAVARPAVKAAALHPFGGGARGVVLVVDTSVSMGAQHTGRRAIDRARERAGRILSDLASDAAVTLVVTRDDLNGGAPRALLENASPSEVRSRLPALRVSFGPNDLGVVFRLVGRKLERLSGRKLVVFVTDLQRRDWRETEATGKEGAERKSDFKRREDVYRALRGLRREADTEPPGLTVLDVGMPETANVAITEFAIEEGREAFAGTLAGLRTRLVNYGKEDAVGNLELYRARADEGTWVKEETRRVTIRPSVGVAGSERAREEQFYLGLPKDLSGPMRVKLTYVSSVGGRDRLPADSRRHLALRVRPPVRFLPVVDLSSAIRGLRDVAVSPAIEFADPVHPSALATADLSGIDIVLWADANLHELLQDERIVKNLENFVRLGGGLLAYLGTDYLPEEVNRTLYRKDRSGLFPMRLVPGEVEIDEEHPVLIDLEPVNDHPLFFEAKYFGSPQILAFRQVRDYREEDVRARYDNDAGDPAVLEHALGLGKVLVVTTTPDERAFRLNGSLLPAIFVFNAAHYLVLTNPGFLNVLVGEAIKLPVPPGTRRVVVRPPVEAGGRTEDPVGDASKPYVYTETVVPGFYRLTAKGVATRAGSSVTTEEVTVAAVNMDPSEGDLRRIPAGELERAYQGTNLRFTERVEDVFPRADGSAEGELSRALLGAVVFLLFLELVLAWRFGSRRRRSA